MNIEPSFKKVKCSSCSKIHDVQVWPATITGWWDFSGYQISESMSVTGHCCPNCSDIIHQAKQGSKVDQVKLKLMLSAR